MIKTREASIMIILLVIAGLMFFFGLKRYQAKRNPPPVQPAAVGVAIDLPATSSPAGY